jgi:hypothetical protein
MATLCICVYIARSGFLAETVLLSSEICIQSDANAELLAKVCLLLAQKILLKVVNNQFNTQLCIVYVDT